MFLEAVYNVTEGLLGPKLENAEKHVDTLEEKVQEVYYKPQDTDYIQDKLINLEDRSCRNNLRVGGVVEEKGKTLYM